jgi:hypothetical protein
MQTIGLIQRLAPGPLDIVGDVHGEIEALGALLEKLGYDRQGAHPDGRRLVFVGDLCDRGPDSPGVIDLVRDLVQRDRAQCILGNHELNLLRNEQKHGNHWYFEGDHAEHEKIFGPSRRVNRQTAGDIHAFFATLPVALERPDLRVVHAAWRKEAIELCRAWPHTALEAYEEFDRRALDSAEGRRLRENFQAERDANRHAMNFEGETPDCLHAVADYEEYHQMSNPVRVLTSGVERVAGQPFYAGGKWRYVERARWWEVYRDDVPVVFGHYWRWWNAASHAQFSKGEPNLFDQDSSSGWHRNDEGREVAFCVDYSAGARFKERNRPRTGPFHGRLAALRWPERDLVFDQGEPIFNQF